MKHPFANLSGSSYRTIKKSLILSDHYCTRTYANYAKKHGQGLTETSFPKSSVLNLEFADVVMAVGLWTTLNESAERLKNSKRSINKANSKHKRA